MVACWRDLTPNNVNPQKGMLQYKELFLFFSDEMWKFIELSWDSINVPNASRWVLCTQSFWRNHPLFMASNIFSYPYTLANMLNNRIHFKGKEQTICTYTNPNRTFCKRTPWGKTILFERMQNCTQKRWHRFFTWFPSPRPCMCTVLNVTAHCLCLPETDT